MNARQVRWFSRLINLGVALVWVINGIYCKLLNQVPRHELIVGRILGAEYARELVVVIGILEVAMAVWILTNVRPRLNAACQILLIGAMNLLEFFLASDLLLWGRWNLVFAFLLLGVIYFNSFILRQTGPFILCSIRGSAIRLR